MKLPAAPLLAPEPGAVVGHAEGARPRDGDPLHDLPGLRVDPVEAPVVGHPQPAAPEVELVDHEAHGEPLDHAAVVRRDTRDVRGGAVADPERLAVEGEAVGRSLRRGPVGDDGEVAGRGGGRQGGDAGQEGQREEGAIRGAHRNSELP
jgi:hypothetical protein